MSCFVNSILNRCCFLSFSKGGLLLLAVPVCHSGFFFLHSSSFSCPECLLVIIASCFFSSCSQWHGHNICCRTSFLVHAGSTPLQFEQSSEGFGSRTVRLVEVQFSWPTSWASMEVKTALGGSDERFRLLFFFFLSWAEKWSDSSLIQSYSSRLGPGCLLNYAVSVKRRGTDKKT